MRIISVKILGHNFRSLTADRLYLFNMAGTDESRLSTKVFAGLNGSGKSNFLELIAEIFYFLEMCQLPDVSEAIKKAKDFGFEIEYLLPLTAEAEALLGPEFAGQKYIQVRILKKLGELAEFSCKKWTGGEYLVVDKDTHLFLPAKVIAYTSGQNELLSDPFYKLKYHYFNAWSAHPKNMGLLSEQHRLLFLDPHIHYAVFIANMLLAEKSKQDYLLQILQIKELRSFRITIQLNAIRNKPLDISISLSEKIRRLKQCATTWVENTEGKKHLLILDFLVNEATVEAFRFHFHTALELFNVFYELEMLNLFLVSPQERKLMLRVDQSYHYADEASVPDPSRLVFRIEKILLHKFVNEERNETVDIDYKYLSDGEHQFNEVIGLLLMMETEGCLFLLDEPDTHFNPMWRAKMIEMLNQVSATACDVQGNIERVRRQEVIITTHSPFIISDTRREDVYKFEKTDHEVHYENPQNIETYGSSINLILQEIFDRPITISDFAYADFDRFRQELQEKGNKEVIRTCITHIRSRLMEFGESIEKFDLYNCLYHLEEEINR